MGRKQGGGTSIHFVIAFPTGGFDHLDRPLTPGQGHIFPWAYVYKANLRLQSRSRDAKEGGEEMFSDTIKQSRLQFG